MGVIGFAAAGRTLFVRGNSNATQFTPDPNVRALRFHSFRYLHEHLLIFVSAFPAVSEIEQRRQNYSPPGAGIRP
jgi:hypothetical protein